MKLSQDTYVDEADRIMKDLCQPNVDGRVKKADVVTTSQIRNILALVSDIYNQILNDAGENLSNDVKGRIEYLRVRCAYEAGRDGKVKEFFEKSKFLVYLKQINGKRSNFLLVQKYLEALVAYHRFYGGRD